MLTVYTSKKYFRKHIIRFIDAAFDRLGDTIQEDFDTVDEAFLKEIDNAGTIRVNDTIFVTKGRAVYELKDISGGAKTCMIAHHIPSVSGYVIDLIHCGQNAITSLFKNLDTTNVPLYLSNQLLDAVIPDLNGIEFSINNKMIGDYTALWRTMHREV